MKYFLIIAFSILTISVRAQLYDSQFGAALVEGQYRTPAAVAQSGTSGFYLTDASSNRIIRADINGGIGGTGNLSWGSTGTGDGQFMQIGQFDVDASTNVYIIDQGLNRIQKFSNGGTFITKWGSKGSGDGQFNNPTSIAVDASGFVYVTDGSNDRIQKFTSAGVYVSQWGGSGTGIGQFSFPTGIDVDASGNVYVADFGNNRIQKFTSSGAYFSTIGSPGNSNGQLSLPWDVNVNGSNLYVTDAGNNRVEVFTTAGAYLTQWSTSGFSLGLECDGTNVIVETGGKVDVYTTSGTFVRTWSGGIIDGQFNSPRSIAIDASGNSCVVDGTGIQKFNSANSFASRIGTQGSGNGQFNGATSLAFDANGNMYVADAGNSRIQKFDNSGMFLLKFGGAGTGNGQFSRYFFVALDPTGNIFALDYTNKSVQKFTSSGNFISKWGSLGTGDSQFNNPSDIAVDANGNVYVSDTGNDRIQKFTNDGIFISKWGGTGTNDGSFNFPQGISVDAAGNVYVTDSKNQRVQKFSNTGTFITKWGSFGSTNGLFISPNDVATNSDGSVYVVDGNNHRVQKFVFPNSITSFTPGTSSSGSSVTISGTNFSTTPANNIVKINGVTATVTASTPTTITATVPSGATTGLITVTVAGQTGTSSGNIVIDNTPPIVANNTPVTVLPAIALNVSASITDAESGVGSVKLQYRPITLGAGGAFVTVDLAAPSSGSTYTSIIPATAVTELGVEYRFNVVNGAGLDNLSTRVFYKTSINHSTGLALSSYPTNAAGTDASSYRMIAIPLILTDKSADGVFSDEIGQYDPTQWRMFKYNGATFSELNGRSVLTPGEGYWFISSSSSPVNTGQGTTVDASTASPFLITLSPGWNQIGNPYNFNISWADIMAANPSQVANLGGNASKIRVFRGAVDNQDVLKTLEGGFVKFLGSTATSIKIPVTKNTGIQGRIGVESKINASLDQPSWEILFDVRNGATEYKLGGLGMHPEAKDAFDYHDDFNSPRFLEYLEIKFPKKYVGMTYTKDVVPTQDNHVWEFNVESNLKENVTSLSWDNSNFGGSKEIYLLDVRTHKVTNMTAQNHYEFNQNESREFKVAFGNESFVKRELLPSIAVLYDPYPNPFANELTVEYALPEAVRNNAAQIEVYNSLGSRISLQQSAEPGVGSWTWKGDSQSPGLYFVMLKSGSQVVTKKILKR